MSDRTSVTVAAAVYLGSAILVGLPVAVGTARVLSALLEAAGRGAALESTAVGLAVLVVALLVGLQLAVEVAAVQLGGLAALHRGSRRAGLARHLGAAVLVGTLLVAAVLAGATTALGEAGPLPLVVGGLVAIAALAALVRGSRAAVEGYRDRRAAEPPREAR